tara:strand:+ start:4142 stop:4258 length:117 start_codon:yes stop_codon:yes gene_type:complete
MTLHISKKGVDDVTCNGTFEQNRNGSNERLLRLKTKAH